MELLFPAHPARTIKQASVQVDGVPTELFLEKFSDRVVIFATQSGKLGMMMSARKDVTFNNEPSYSVDVLLGAPGRGASMTTASPLSAEDHLLACARRLVADIDNTNLPLLLCIAIKHPAKLTKDSIRQLLQHILERKVW